jgi:very-short-patch-repair endonuclease
MTISEARLWVAIRGSLVGARFRRQVPIGYWAADFASLNPRLVIEVDDTSHAFRDESIRTGYFALQGFPVLRFNNKRIAQELPEVVATIEAWFRHIRIHGEAPE